MICTDSAAEALEAQIVKGKDGPAKESTELPSRSWNSQYQYPEGRQRNSQYSNVSAPSPTAFLEMLSSAASVQVPEPSDVTGLRSGAASSAMMTGAPSWTTNNGNRDSNQQSTGLTPFLSYSDSQAIDAAASQNAKPANQRQATTSTNDSGTSRRSSQQSGQSSFGMTSNSSPAVPSGLSPTNVFNFSPAASGPTAPTALTAQQNLNWAPPPEADGQIQPSDRTEGPWRSIETVDTVFQGVNNSNAAPMNADASGFAAVGQNGDVDMDGFPQVDEAMQQQLLMDLFWPGWPPNLPEPHIVNEL